MVHAHDTAGGQAGNPVDAARNEFDETGSLSDALRVGSDPGGVSDPRAATGDILAGLGDVFGATNTQFGKGGVHDILGTGFHTKELLGRMPSFYDIQNLSPTQAQAFQGALSQDFIDPQDFISEILGQLRGFNPGVNLGQRAQVSSFLR